MLYHLINHLGSLYDFPGERLINYLSFRAGVGVLLALIMGLVFGKRIIGRLQKMLIGEEIRDLGIEGQLQKKGTPTMGGIIILLCILVPTLLLADLTNMYTWLMIISTVWLGTLGFLDDYIKVFKKNKAGLQGKFKIIGQVGIGVIVSLILYKGDTFTVQERIPDFKFQISNYAQADTQGSSSEGKSEIRNLKAETQRLSAPHKSTTTTIPFFKNNEFDYTMLVPDFFGEHKQDVGWLIFMLVTIFIIAAVSNGANLTDGMDGLASGVSIIIGITLGILAYLSNNIIYADYLQIMYIPGSGELVIFMAIVIGALIGFLWYNTYPAQVFMGDTGSLALGGIIGVFAIVIRKELLIPILCGIFFVESLSVILQTAYFKYSKHKYGEGRRIFKMSPLHHHFQKPGDGSIKALMQKPYKPLPEAKIVVRFWIVAALLAITAILTLKVR
ncbi:MAG: phospho-N-acetylmuramoyl-pentapeptide-transferase [Prevotellaceae bacterium]|jgi:phospho-N-acetylmuramoyl-pentapeptide-transferase|nr:phospho-N-acetylmuramoyl-pentapeptide-transferase [Prevotellaceae bacterium]